MRQTDANPGKDPPMRLALATVALMGLATAAFPLTPKIYPEITLTGGEAQGVPDTDITLVVTKVDDARCPPDVDCYWEGMIRVELTVLTPTSKQEIVLCNQCDDGAYTAEAAGRRFGLIGLAPSTAELAKLGRAPELGDYLVTVNYDPPE
jgi:hypothetical protein